MYYYPGCTYDHTCGVQETVSVLAVADPGFPERRGADPVGGPPRSDVVTLRKISVYKRKNLDAWGRAGAPSLDPPMTLLIRYIVVLLNELSDRQDKRMDELNTIY